MDRFNELIYQQLEMADRMIKAEEEIRGLEHRLRSGECGHIDNLVSELTEKRQSFTQLETDFENLISKVINCYQKTTKV
ncbi:hypothetical protein [Pseudalkalibacillus caeni]|uniref:Uncharacterized protein n=1 Tax=Exobacillus caeni TaxID=2574798 RepID=A0A5R9F4G0_9BACL|nr:hypothetical protein [Pseudalkalibacillus caeni]TLS35703.1 hypothetical protein FCL54_18775 [Pseudalkalibacillus caeni]